MVEYVAAVGEVESGVVTLLVVLGFGIAFAFVGYVMYWSLHHHHADYDDNDWEG